MRGHWWVAAWAFVSLSGCNALRKTSECSSNHDCPRGTACDVDHGFCQTGGPIVIGYLAGVTGKDAALTEERRIGLEFGRWIVERDPSRKVLGRGISFHIQDTVSTPSEVPGATARLLDQNLAALIGPAPSGDVLEAQKLTYPRRMLHLAPNGGAPSLGDAQPADLQQRFLFQMVNVVTDTLPTLPLLFTVPNLPSTYATCFDGMAIVTSDDIFGSAIKETLEDPTIDLLGKNCLPRVLSISVPVLPKESYTAEVDQLLRATNKDGKPTRCLFLALQTPAAGGLLRALSARQATMSRAPYNAFIGSSTLNTANFFEDANSPIAGAPSLAEGFYGIDADANPVRTELRDLEALWKEYVDATHAVASGVGIGENRGPYIEAVIALSLAIELAGTVEDPVALRDAFVDVTRNDPGDNIFGPKGIPAAFALIRRAREDGRRAGINYQASYSNLEFSPQGFVHTSTVVWRAQAKQLERVRPFTEDDVAAAAAAPYPGPACAQKPK